MAIVNLMRYRIWQLICMGAASVLEIVHVHSISSGDLPKGRMTSRGGCVPASLRHIFPNAAELATLLL